jgi:hypothetical protein
VFCKPRIGFPRGAVHGAFDEAVVRRGLAAGPGALPDVRAVGVDFGVEGVVRGYVCLGVGVDGVGEEEEARAVAVVVGGGSGVPVGSGEEEVGMDGSGVVCQRGCFSLFSFVFFFFLNVGRGLYSCRSVFTMSSRGRYLRRASESFSRMGLYLPWSSLSSSQMPAQLRGESAVRTVRYLLGPGRV